MSSTDTSFPSGDHPEQPTSSLVPALIAMVSEMAEQRKSQEKERELVAKERKSEHRARILFQALLFGVPALIAICYFVFFLSTAGFRLGPLSDVVGVVRINGEISPGKTASANNIIPSLERAFQNPNVKAVILSIDSGGGAPVEAERIYTSVLALKAKYPKKIYAVIDNIGASAAYMIAMHCDKVYAGRMSLVGSIGAVMSPWQFDRAMAKLDVTQRVYASGKLKSFLNPFSPVTPEMDVKAHALVDQMGQHFVDDVRATRGKALKAGIDIGTGEVWGGVEAKSLGLIDEIGTIESVVEKNWGLASYDFGPRESGFGVVSSAFSEHVDLAMRQFVGSLSEPRLR